MTHLLRQVLAAATMLSLSVPSVIHASDVAATAPPANAFTCGPYMETYTVTSLDARQGSGIRCVKWSDGSQSRSRVPAFAWYGEGYWFDCAYRHVGQAFASRNPKTSPYKGFSSDIMGNGECGNASYPGSLVMEIVNDGVIRVTGAWNEEWTRVTSADYRPLPAPTGCGKYFDEYRAVSIDAYRKEGTEERPTRSGEGLRCMLKVGPRSTTWYGVGAWEGKAYIHLATGSTKGYGASDFCGAPADFCSDFHYGTILRRMDRGLRAPVVDGWNEVWLKTKARL